jgi:hypothetical protein
MLTVTVLWKLALNLRWLDKLIWERPLDGYLDFGFETLFAPVET